MTMAGALGGAVPRLGFGGLLGLRAGNRVMAAARDTAACIARRQLYGGGGLHGLPSLGGLGGRVSAATARHAGLLSRMRWAPARLAAAARRAPVQGKATLAAMQTAHAVDVSSRRALGAWMTGLSGAVFGMVAVGGYTRLTRSGLSMTEWRLTGSKLPSTDEEWAVEFDKYKNFPEYKKLNQDMSIDEFKSIYFWEWFHRMWGRSLGVLFAVPAVVFIARSPTRATLAKMALYPRLAVLFSLGGTQGLVGWWMVKSGLNHEHVLGFERPESDMPRVSPYRLATHLSFAFVTYGLLAWTAMDLLERPSLSKEIATKVSELGAPALRQLKRFRLGVKGAVGLIGLTIFSGAFVAGNLAGLAYNDWPLMGGKFIPTEICGAWHMYTPRVRNVFENVAMVQFDHRMLAYSTLAAGTTLAVLARRGAGFLPKATLFRANCLMAMVWVQASLGVATIIYEVPVELGVLHQAGALTAWTLSIWLLHSLKHARKVVPRA